MAGMKKKLTALFEENFPQLEEREAALSSAGGCVVTAVNDKLKKLSKESKQVETLGTALETLIPDEPTRAAALSSAGGCVVTVVNKLLKELLTAVESVLEDPNERDDALKCFGIVGVLAREICLFKEDLICMEL